MWTRAAELIRHTSTAWPEADARRFGDWLIAQYLPDIDRMGPCPGGNWHASGVEARIDVKPSYGLSDDQIARMLQEGFATAQQDVRTRALVEAAAPEQASGGDDLDGRHGQAKGARAGHDQHGGGAQQRLARAESDRPDAREGEQGQGVALDNWADDNFDHSALDFIGGGNLFVYSDRRPIDAANMPTFGKPNWGSAWKAFVKENADRWNLATMQKTTLPFEDNVLDLDPTVKDQQFCDVGPQYRSGIYWQNEAERATAEASRDALIKSGRFSTIHTELAPSSAFHLAEEYHQDYYKKNELRYSYYRLSCGRDARVKKLWG